MALLGGRSGDHGERRPGRVGERGEPAHAGDVLSRSGHGATLLRG